MTTQDRTAAEGTLQAGRAFERLGAGLDARKTKDLLQVEAVAEGRVETVVRDTRTFMFTDIVKSTDLVEAMGDEAWEDVLRWHDDTLRSLFLANGGEEIKHQADAFFVAFDSPTQAVDCAVASADSRSIGDRRASRRRSASGCIRRRRPNADAITREGAYT